MNDYKKLAAIVESTKDRKQPLELRIAGLEGVLYLQVVRRSDLRGSSGRKKNRWSVLATAPFEPGQEDEAARDIARQLTLDGQPPVGM